MVMMAVCIDVVKCIQHWVMKVMVLICFRCHHDILPKTNIGPEIMGGQKSEDYIIFFWNGFLVGAMSVSGTYMFEFQLSYSLSFRLCNLLLKQFE